MFSVICTKFLNVSAFSTWLFYWFKLASTDVGAGSKSTSVQSQCPSSKMPSTHKDIFPYLILKDFF